MKNQTLRVVQRWAPFLIVTALFLLAPQFLSAFRLNQLGRFLTYALVAIGLRDRHLRQPIDLV